MKINNVNRVNVNPYEKHMDKRDKTEKNPKRDKVEISSEALELQKGNSLELERQKKVEELREKVQSGNYEVNPQEVAQKMADFWKMK